MRYALLAIVAAACSHTFVRSVRIDGDRLVVERCSVSSFTDERNVEQCSVSVQKIPAPMVAPARAEVRR